MSIEFSLHSEPATPLATVTQIIQSIEAERDHYFTEVQRLEADLALAHQDRRLAQAGLFGALSRVTELTGAFSEMRDNRDLYCERLHALQLVHDQLVELVETCDCPDESDSGRSEGTDWEGREVTYLSMPDPEGTTRIEMIRRYLGGEE